MNELTSVSYWLNKQSHLKPISIKQCEKPEWLNVLLQYLKSYEGGSFIEIGCCPGYVSALICSYIKFIPFGIDFSPMSHLYIESMKEVGYENATLFNCDIRDFKLDEEFDVVGSVGLVEHFKDPFDILLHHYRLAKQGGVIFCAVPNFRYLQWLYHFIFDKDDLKFHNREAMRLRTFIDFSKKVGLEILYLGYCGRIRFWGIGLDGNKFLVLLKRVISRMIREVSNKILSRLLTPDSKFYSPWIVYIALKKHEVVQK